MPIEKLPKRPIESLIPDASCATAARRMRDANVGAIVVQEDGRPVGVVTDRNITLRVVAEGLEPEETAVAEVMSTAPVFLPHERSLGELVSAMRDLAIRRVVGVEDDGIPEGVVSMDDLLILHSDQLGQLASTIRTEIRAPQDQHT
jgi:signal-transduction protein with cAMP-binding, CBS, and nucleotidyltransferase domain